MEAHIVKVENLGSVVELLKIQAQVGYLQNSRKTAVFVFPRYH